MYSRKANDFESNLQNSMLTAPTLTFMWTLPARKSCQSKKGIQEGSPRGALNYLGTERVKMACMYMYTVNLSLHTNNYSTLLTKLISGMGSFVSKTALHKCNCQKNSLHAVILTCDFRQASPMKFWANYKKCFQLHNKTLFYRYIYCAWKNVLWFFTYHKNVVSR